MKTLIIIATILILSFSAFADEWHEEQAAHFGGEFAITVCTYKTLQEVFHVSKWKSLIAGVVLASVVGIGKELIDEEIGEKDLLVDAVGIGAGVLFVYAVEFDGDFRDWK